MGSTGEEGALGGVPELTWITAITTATAATTLPTMLHNSVRPGRIRSRRSARLTRERVAARRLEPCMARWIDLHGPRLFGGAVAFSTHRTTCRPEAPAPLAAAAAGRIREIGNRLRHVASD